MNKILVIGGSGFIGMNIVDSLKKHNEYASVYDIRECSIGIDNYVGNIKDDDNFDNIISQYDEVIYLITTVSPKKSMQEPSAAYINDVPLLIRTLDSCIKNNIKRVIFSSSGGTVYGDSNTKSKETDFNEPINHYAVCKLTCEKILEMYNKLYGMENISLRISNPYGKGQNPKSGVGAITAFANMVKNGEEISLYGDGTITRDFVDVCEVADAFYLSTIWNYNRNITPVFNIGSGQGLTLNQIIKIISDVLECETKINYLPEREFDVKYNVLDIAKAEQYLGYKSSGDQTNKIKEYIKKYYR